MRDQGKAERNCGFCGKSISEAERTRRATSNRPFGLGWPAGSYLACFRCATSSEWNRRRTGRSCVSAGRCERTSTSGTVAARRHRSPQRPMPCVRKELTSIPVDRCVHPHLGRSPARAPLTDRRPRTAVQATNATSFSRGGCNRNPTSRPWKIGPCRPDTHGQVALTRQRGNSPLTTCC